MTIEPGDTFEPQCNKFVGFMLLMEPGKKVTFQKKAEPELSNSPFDLETIDSTGDCSLSAENFTQALQRKTDCFVADRGGYFNCQIKNPKSVREALYHGCFSEKRILNGSYNCINSSSAGFTLTTKQPSMLEQKLPTSNPQSDRRDGAGRFETPCATCSTTESPSRNACSTYEGSERSYLDANGECQPSPANLKELNL
uniref:X8 domain-containing protein n=1 Tax=Macrostomum lignano TaxID=282301 RepID=A0A1I8FUZ5_9PLAT